MKQTQKSIALMKAGFTTALQSAMSGGVMALSQTVGKLEARGYLFARRTLTTPSGSRPMAYKLLKEPKKECK
jgi:hypothetical protein